MLDSIHNFLLPERSIHTLLLPLNPHLLTTLLHAHAAKSSFLHNPFVSSSFLHLYDTHLSFPFAHQLFLQTSSRH
ncbi:hypothetical protein JHK84_055142 [Glycine max]|nr:hypothetical protein JHK85_056091 [Glycine max]KAG5073911.1 hypothetical protein JHK84_055142 [Glycine max]